MQYVSYYKSPIGILEIICENDKLISLKYTEKEKGINTEKNQLFNKINKQLDEYFKGTRKTFDIEILCKGSDFQKRVWQELLKIPYGEIRSYSEIAENIGNPKAQRAVGSACNKNPIMIIIPCHRVVSKNKGIGGYAFGKEIKEKLLKLENL